MSKWHGGKGSAPRHVDPKKWEENWEKIWGKKEEEKGDKKDERSSK